MRKSVNLLSLGMRGLPLTSSHLFLTMSVAPGFFAKSSGDHGSLPVLGELINVNIWLLKNVKDDVCS